MTLLRAAGAFVVQSTDLAAGPEFVFVEKKDVTEFTFGLSCPRQETHTTCVIYGSKTTGVPEKLDRAVTLLPQGHCVAVIDVGDVLGKLGALCAFANNYSKQPGKRMDVIVSSKVAQHLCTARDSRYVAATGSFTLVFYRTSPLRQGGRNHSLVGPHGARLLRLPDGESGQHSARAVVKTRRQRETPCAPPVEIPAPVFQLRPIVRRNRREEPGSGLGHAM